MFGDMTKARMYAYLMGMFCALIIMSNILATKTFNIGFIMLPCSILTFPLLFIINDILSEIYGYEMTRKVIYLGLALNIIAVALYTLAIAIPSNSPNAEAFSTILATTPRLFVAGILSYTAGNILNSKVMVKFKEKYSRLLFARCIISTAIGEVVDSIIFITIGFFGVFSTDLIITMICCQVVFKVLYELISYPLTRKVIFHIEKLDDGELENII